MTKFTKCPHCQKVLKVSKFGSTPKHKTALKGDGIRPVETCEGSNKIVKHSLYAPSKSNLDFSLVPYAFTPVKEAPVKEAPVKEALVKEAPMESLNNVMETLQDAKADYYDTGTILISNQQYKEMMEELKRVREALYKAEKMETQLEAIKSLIK
tara:strand:- start:607 stop:1068 length:462 start_codon:yes stop_codon:yes gene_type:complete